MRLLSTALLAPLVLAMSSAAMATGRAEVSFQQPENFTDAGFGSVERSRTEAALTAILARLASRLPDGQVLQVQVVDVDLAGERRPIRHEQIRVMGVGADAPRIELQFSLRQGDQVILAGSERLIDLDYLSGARYRLDEGPLPFEQRLLQRWFRDRFASQVAALR